MRQNVLISRVEEGRKKKKLGAADRLAVSHMQEKLRERKNSKKKRDSAE